MFDLFPLFALITYLLFIRPIAGVIAFCLTPIYYYVLHHTTQYCFAETSTLIAHSACVRDKMVQYYLYYVVPTVTIYAILSILLKEKRWKKIVQYLRSNISTGV